jgi:hypothetical protein
MKTLQTPFNVLRHNDWSRVPRDPVTIGLALLGPGLAGTAILGTTLGVIVGNLAISMVTSWALSALSPKPDFSSFSSSGLQVNAREPAAAHDFVYGEIRKGGTVSFYESTGAENKYLHQIIVLAGHEVNDIGDIYVNDEIVTLDANGFVTSGAWDSKIRIKKHKGDQTAADSDLVSETSVDSNFKGLGLSYLYVRYEFDQDVFANGVPLITAVVQGKKVYDPRSDTTVYSNNAALCMRDFITSSYGLNDSAIDDGSFAAAANESDEIVALAGSGSEKRYQINGTVKSSSPIGNVLQNMATACAGTLFWGMGAWKLKVGAYSSPVKTLTLDDLRSSITLDTRTTMRDNFNAVRGTFNDSSQGFITADYPEIASAAFKTEDNGEEVALDLSLPFTTSAAAAQRIAKLTLYRGREQMSLSAEFGMEAFGVEVGDIIAFTNPRYGFDEKEFEVVSWSLAANQDAGDLRVSLGLRETSAAAFNWNAEETAITSNNTTLPAFSVVNAPTNLTLTTTAVINNDGITIPAIKADWDVSSNAFVQYYEIQYKRLGGEEDYGSIADAQTSSENWGSITVSATETEDYGLTNEPILTPDVQFSSVFGSSNSYTIEPVLNGYDYQIKVRAVSALGVRSPFATAEVSSEGDVTPPNEPLSVSAIGGSKYIAVEWTNPADQDFSHVEVWENNTNNLSTAEFVGSSPSSNFVRPNLANYVTKFYWVRAVDYSLNKSDYSAPVSATTALITPDDFNSAVNDMFSDAGAFGVEPVDTLPASGGFDGQLVLLKSNVTIYRWDATTSAWSTDLFTASSVDPGSLTYTSFASGIEPIGVVSSLPTVAGYSGPQVVVLTTDGKLYRLVSGAWTAAVNTADIDGTIGENLFSDDLRPIEKVATLPSTGLTQGRVVMLTTDNKLYRYTGSEWTSAVPAVDLTGQIDGTQISDAAITASKIGLAAITTAKLANDSVTSDILAASSVDSTALKDAAVSADKIGTDAVTTAKIANDAVTADLIASDAITETKISDDAITTDKIKAGSVVAAKIATGAITADAMAANSVTAAAIEAGSITASEIEASTITSGLLAADSVTASAILAGTITANEIAADAITANELAANTITAAEIEAGAITATEIAAATITSGLIAADAITADAILADTITSSEIAADAITANELAADSVTANAIEAGTITSSEIAADAITADAIAANAVTADAIAANTITASELAADSVEAAAIKAGAVSTTELAADAITSDKIAANAITATEIAADAITSTKIAADSVLSDNIVSSAIVTSKLAAGSVTFDKLQVTNLSSVFATIDNVDITETIELATNRAGFLAGRTSASAYTQDGFFIGREDRGGGVTGFEFTHTSTLDDRIAGLIHSDEKGLQVFNPQFFFGGSLDGGTTLKTVSGTYNAGETTDLTITAIGGGGGGGYGRGNYTGSGSASSGGGTTIRVRAGSPTGTLIYELTSAGAAGGLNAPVESQSNGLAGQASTYGPGGAQVGEKTYGNDAPSTSYGAGGGGGGGDNAPWYQQDGGGGHGGYSATPVTHTLTSADLAAYAGQDIYIEVLIGAGGAGGAAEYVGGDGASGAATYTSLLGGTDQYELSDLAAGSGTWHEVPNGTYSTGVNYLNSRDKAVMVYYKNYYGGGFMKIGPTTSSLIDFDYNDADGDLDGGSFFVVPKGHYFQFVRLNNPTSQTIKELY